jgi:hypothetical protein
MTAADRLDGGQDLIPCCDHCGCAADDRTGHDDICAIGCSDPNPALAHVLAEVAAEVQRQDDVRGVAEVPTHQTRDDLLDLAAHCLRSVLAIDQQTGDGS